MIGNADTNKKIVNRLRRAQGQLNAIVNAAESGASCQDIVTQLSAVSSALDKAGFAIIASAMRDCVWADAEDEAAEAAGASTASAGTTAEAGAGKPAPRGERLTVEQLEKLFLSLA